MLGGGNAACETQRLIKVFGFEHVIAAGHFRVLGEWAVGDDRRVWPAGDAHAGRRREQRVAAADRRSHLGVKGLIGRHLAGPLVGRAVALLADQ
ncbi:hypothetical protein NIIDMKKI_63790 [Mycobacterium kansasii]|uniref:Uncharacterized protein n=1 Tax=Mycobacterium kansasii TaxID=1768 RepID=A0A7G1IMR6_MYCKA|nr:hypothetical protein NIIDMKKI_63790 [Mycobacterium kansasii]